METNVINTITNETTVSVTTGSSGIVGQPGSCSPRRLSGNTCRGSFAVRQWNGGNGGGNVCLVIK